MIKQAVIVTIAVFISVALNYIFNFLMVRMLVPAIYGELSILIGIFTVFMVPGTTIQTLLTREIAKLDRDQKESTIIFIIRKYTKITFFMGLVAAVLLFIFSYLIAGALNNPQLTVPIQLISIGIPIGLLLPILRSYYQGKERMAVLSGTLIANPLLKLIVGFSLVFFGFGLLGATFSLWIGSLALMFFLIPIFLKKTEGIAESFSMNKSFFYILSASILMIFFFYLDLFFVRYFLGPEQAGFYNVASITSKILAYAIGGSITVFLPKSSKLDIFNDKARIRKLLGESLLLMIPIFIVFISFPKLIITLFYTESYIIAATPFVILSVGMFIFAFFRLFVNLMWSQHKEKIPLIITSVMILTNIFLLVYLVPIHGLVGAAMSTTLAGAVSLVLSLFAMRKIF